MTTYRVTLERTRTITERAEVDVDDADGADPVVMALSRSEHPDVVWEPDDSSIGDEEVLTCERLPSGRLPRGLASETRPAEMVRTGEST